MEIEVKEAKKVKSDKAYRTIGEVSTIIGVPQYVIRFWESKFTQINPQKNKGRRYYNPENIKTLEEIRDLLYKKKFTISGVKQFIGEKKVTEGYYDLFELQKRKNSKNQPLYDALTQLKTIKTKIEEII